MAGRDEILKATDGQLNEWIADILYTRHKWEEWPGLAKTVVCQHCQRTAPKMNPERVGPYCHVLLSDMVDLLVWADDMGEAWHLVEELTNADEWDFELETWGELYPLGKWSAVFYGGDDDRAGMAWGDTAAMAICRAYLLARGVGRKEDDNRRSPK